DTTCILPYLLAIVLILNSQSSKSERYTLSGNDTELSMFAKFKPILLSKAVILAAAVLDTYRHKMDAERLVFYTALSSVVLLFFSNLLASWLWLIPICLLYAIMNEKNDLGAFIFVFVPSFAFLEVS